MMHEAAHQSLKGAKHERKILQRKRNDKRMNKFQRGPIGNCLVFHDFEDESYDLRSWFSLYD